MCKNIGNGNRGDLLYGQGAGQGEVVFNFATVRVQMRLRCYVTRGDSQFGRLPTLRCCCCSRRATNAILVAHQWRISGASVAHLALGHFVVPELAHLLKPGMQPVIAYRLACTKFRFHCRGESLGRCFAMAILFGDNSLSSPDKLSST